MDEFGISTSEYPFIPSFILKKALEVSGPNLPKKEGIFGTKFKKIIADFKIRRL